MKKSIVVFLALCGALVGCHPSDVTHPLPKVEPAIKWNGTDLTGALPKEALHKWRLVSTRSGAQRLGLDDFSQQVVLLFFGYAQCPDVCPTTLSRLARVLKSMGKSAERIQVLFVTVDPERDTLPLMQRYVTQFDPRFVGLWGTPEEIRQVADSFKVFFQKNPLPGGGYTVDHTAGVFMMDTHGELRALLSDSLTDAQVKMDLEQLLHP
jgi:protein SCO1